MSNAIVFRPCLSQPCDKLVASGYCPAHARPDYRTTKQKGYDSDWERLRKRFMAWRCLDCGVIPEATCCRCRGTGLANQFCAECLLADVLTLAIDVDHIIPISERGDLRLRSWNLQALCKQHHTAKTLAEQNDTPLPAFQLAQRRRVMGRLRDLDESGLSAA